MLHATFRAAGRHRVVGLGDSTVVVADLTGLRSIARLLASPGREVHVLDLVAAEVRVRPSDGAGPRALAADALPVIDDAARAAYRRRLADVEEDIDEATRLNDLGRLALAERDREYLLAELGRAVGLGGRSRLTGGTTERARTSVTRSIRYALKRLAEQHPGLAAHLERHVRTGTYCCYEPDDVVTVTWEL